jgi:serine/threonine-protein kinase PRP4
MRRKKAGMKEIGILEQLAAADPDDKKHIVRFIRHFEHKGHLCMVFENLSLNLREVVKRFGRDVGINIRAVRAYAQQMFLAASLLRKCNLLHADVKPDNILVNEAHTGLKICDLGSAAHYNPGAPPGADEITPYLVSRYYRAPEIILGMQPDPAIDMWSIGCTLFELYTGKILFAGRSNNQMLKVMMECRGKFSTKMLKRAPFAPLYFDDLGNFQSIEKDKLTGRDVPKLLNLSKPVKDLKARLTGFSGEDGKKADDAQIKELNLFRDLLEKCLELNPEKRITPGEALKHPFILRLKA